MTSEHKILGIDYGSRYVGLAIGFAEKKISLPRPHLLRTSDLDLVGKISVLCRDENISQIVLGLPSFGRIRNKVLAFKKILEKNFPNKVILWNEDNSSQITDFLSDELDKKRQKGKSDSMAATVILQDFLDFKP